MTNEELGDPKCWICATVKKPDRIYGPNICDECLPEYKKRKFVWTRWTAKDIEELFPGCRSILDTGGN